MCEKKLSSPVVNYNFFLEKSKVEFIQKFENKDVDPPKSALKDFEHVRTLGMGSFGRVVLSKNKTNNVYYAIKILDKGNIIRVKQKQHVLNEKKILESINHPFLVNMECSFKDNSFIYFVLPFVMGGELFLHLRKEGQFNEKRCKFYASQVVLALEYLQYNDLIHRDIKPENILLDVTGYIKLTDFGFCKLVKGRTYSFCGTPEYLAPEIITNKGYGAAVDWWSLGILIYEMASGRTPFYTRDQLKLCDRILSGRYQTPSFFSIELKDIVKNLLQVDLTKRFGNLRNGVGDIKNHPWFLNMDWLQILNMQVKPQFVPKVKAQHDTAYFERYEEQVLAVASMDLYQREFQDF